MIKVIHGENQIIVDNVSLLIKGVRIAVSQVEASFLRSPHDSGIMTAFIGRAD